MVYNFNFSSSLVNQIENPCMLFLHGFMGNREEFSSVIRFLKTNFCCVSIDLPGHGKNILLDTELENEKPYSMSQVAEGIIDFLDSFNICKCLLVGYSMGGRLGLYLGINYPHRFSHLILESASPGLATIEEREARIKNDLGIARKLNRCLQANDFQQFLINWYQQPIFGQISHHPDFPQMLQQRLQCHPLELAKSLQYMGTGVQPSLWDKLANLQLPVLLIVGEQDRKFVEINQKMCSFNPKFLLQIIKNCGHNIHWEQPQQFAEIIRDFSLTVHV